MKSIVNLSSILLTCVLFACSKTDRVPDPDPNPLPPTHFTVQFKPTGLGNLTDAIGDLEFIVSLRNSANEPVLVDQKLALRDSNGLYTARFSIPVGSYKLEKFLLARKTGLVRFATPLAGFPKAQLIQQPLSIEFSNSQQHLKLVGVEMLPVTTNDSEAMFGYPEGVFHLPSDPNNPPPTRTIRVHPAVKIESIVYDSIPALIWLDGWDAQNQQTTIPITLPAGVSQLELPTAAVRYKFRMTKWGHSAELSLNAADIQPGQIYLLQAVAAPRKLKQILGNRWVNNNWFAETKTEFQYDGAGLLQAVLHYRKTTNNTPYLAMTEELQYTNGRVSRILRKNESAVQIGNSSFQYNADGLLSMIRLQQGDSITHIQLSYITYLDRYNQTQVSQVGASYEFNFSTLRYQFSGDMDKGRMLKTTYASNNGNLQESLIQYDQLINPFLFTGLPNEKNFVYSLHNRNGQSTTYQNEYTASEPYQFTYSYDGFGYPTELRTSHRNPVTQQHLYDYREVYVY